MRFVERPPMDKAFKRDVGPLVLDDAGITLGAGDRIGYFWTDAQFGAEFICLNGAHLNYENTLKLIDWLNAATGGEGWKLVPKEPTGAMLGMIAGEYNEWPRMTRDQAVTVYRALLAAAPQVGD